MPGGADAFPIPLHRTAHDPLPHTLLYLASVSGGSFFPGFRELDSCKTGNLGDRRLVPPVRLLDLDYFLARKLPNLPAAPKIQRRSFSIQRIPLFEKALDFRAPRPGATGNSTILDGHPLAKTIS